MTDLIRERFLLPQRMRDCWRKLDPTHHDPVPSEILEASALLAAGATELERARGAVGRWQDSSVAAQTERDACLRRLAENDEEILRLREDLETQRKIDLQIIAEKRAALNDALEKAVLINELAGVLRDAERFLEDADQAVRRRGATDVADAYGITRLLERTRAVLAKAPMTATELLKRSDAIMSNES